MKLWDGGEGSFVWGFGFLEGGRVVGEVEGRRFIDVVKEIRGGGGGKLHSVLLMREKKKKKK